MAIGAAAVAPAPDGRVVDHVPAAIPQGALAVALAVGVAPVVSAEQLTVAVNNAVQKKGKKIDKTKCFRCGVAGHLSGECTISICVICEGPEHTDGPCPIIAAPKPQLIMYGYAHEELIFFSTPALPLIIQR